MRKAVLRISGVRPGSAIRKSLPAATVEGEDVLITSQLPDDAPLNDHLVWLWGFLKHERRYLKSLHTEGAAFTIHVPASRRPIMLKPNGAEMLHLLGITLIVGAA
jgi:hypothetical protein